MKMKLIRIEEVTAQDKKQMFDYYFVPAAPDKEWEAASLRCTSDKPTLYVPGKEYEVKVTIA